MLTATGVKLLDFGLAKWLSGPSEAGVTSSTLIGVGLIAGTLQYMAPEQIDGQPVDERCDIFALGAIIYEMLAGRPAFSGDTASSTMAAILVGQPAPLRNLHSGVPPALIDIVAKCLAKRPADRWTSAADLADALREAGAQIGHVHFADSNRRAIGFGHTAMAPIIGALSSKMSLPAASSWLMSADVPADSQKRP